MRQLALGFLPKPQRRRCAENAYLSQGWQEESFGPYFPANGGLLLAVGMAAGGWGEHPAPLAGLPSSWRARVRSEGFGTYV